MTTDNKFMKNPKLSENCNLFLNWYPFSSTHSTHRFYKFLNLFKNTFLVVCKVDPRGTNKPHISMQIIALRLPLSWKQKGTIQRQPILIGPIGCFDGESVNRCVVMVAQNWPNNSEYVGEITPCETLECTTKYMLFNGHKITQKLYRVAPKSNIKYRFTALLLDCRGREVAVSSIPALFDYQIALVSLRRFNDCFRRLIAQCSLIYP